MAMHDKPEPLIGASVAIRTVQEELEYAAQSDAKVLLTGESGAGKEVVARLIHQRSRRSHAPLVTMNCAGVPDSLLESELFGHVRGSFTGAVRDRSGLLEVAHGGTIFMDEVGEMSPRMQALLLRFLEGGEVQRVGAERRSAPVDVRVIAATNKNLEEEITRGTFREDLFYRLNVIPIHVPPLRERRDDVPTLVRHFADLFARENNFRRKTFTTAAMERLRQHTWRGNIRELRNFVERLIIMSPGDQIDVRDLPEFGTPRADAPPAGGALAPSTAAPAATTAADWAQVATLQEFKSTSERAFLVAKLRENGWNISKTAEVIDTPRSNLYKKLEQYQISQESDG